MSGGELLTRGAVFAALVLAVFGSAERLTAGDRPGPRRKQWMLWTRWAWTGGCLAYLVHVAAAFHYTYDWSHGVAYRATARQTAEVFGLDWGGGLYVNYAFTIAWMADVARRWWAGERYRRLPGALATGWRLFFLFMVFNGAVVFGSTPARWLGAVVCLALVALWWLPLPGADKPPARHAIR